MGLIRGNPSSLYPYQRCTFNVTGTIMASKTNLNFYLADSYIRTEYLRGGFNLDLTCDSPFENTLYGDIFIKRNAIVGDKFLSLSTNLISVLSLNNVTFSDNYIDTWHSTADIVQYAFEFSDRGDCSLSSDDGRTRYLTHSGNYFT